MTKMPEPGDTRIRAGHVEEWEAAREKGDPFVEGSTLTIPASWRRTGEIAAGARMVHVYAERFSYAAATFMLAPNETIIGVENLSGGERHLWIAQEEESK